MREDNGVLNPDQTAVDAVVARLTGKPKASLGETIKDSAKRAARPHQPAARTDGRNEAGYSGGDRQVPRH